MTRDVLIERLAVKISEDRGHHPEDVDDNDRRHATEYVAMVERGMRDFRWHSER